MIGSLKAQLYWCTTGKQLSRGTDKRVVVEMRGSWQGGGGGGAAAWVASGETRALTAKGTLVRSGGSGASGQLGRQVCLGCHQGGVAGDDGSHVSEAHILLEAALQKVAMPAHGISF